MESHLISASLRYKPWENWGTWIHQSHTGMMRCPLGCYHFCREPWSVTQPKELLHLNFLIIPSFATHPILHLLQTWWRVFDTVFVNLHIFIWWPLVPGKNLLCPKLYFGFGVQVSSKKVIELKGFWSLSSLGELYLTWRTSPPWFLTTGFAAFDLLPLQLLQPAVQTSRIASLCFQT